MQDDPLSLAKEFIVKHQLDADAVVSSTPAGSVTVLQMLVDHISTTKAAAYQRVLAALPRSDEISISSNDGIDVEVEEAAARNVQQQSVAPPPPPPIAGRAPTVPPPLDHGDDESVSGRARSVVSNSSSTRRLMGTDEERELQYMALKSQFVHPGKSVAGSSQKPGPRARASSSVGGGSPRVASPRKESPLPRVATLKARNASPPPAIAVPTRQKRTPTAAETPLFNRLYGVRC